MKTTVNKIIKRVLAMMLSVTLVATLMPSGELRDNAEVVRAKENNNISIMAYATPEQLKDSDNFAMSSDYKGVAKKIEFGKRFEYGKDTYQSTMNWYIAGEDSSTGGLVLMAAHSMEPGILRPFDNELRAYNTRAYKSEWGCTYESEPRTVYKTHYGGSFIRRNLQKIEQNNKCFSMEEHRLMQTTTIYSKDAYNDTIYSTSDKLYLAYGEKSLDTHITVGSNCKSDLRGNLKIDLYNMSYVEDKNAEMFWLRSHPDTHVYEVFRAAQHYELYTNDPIMNYSTYPAFSLNLSSLLFASSVPATASSESGSLDSIHDEHAFVMRYDGRDKLNGAYVEYNESDITVTAPANSTLVVQYNDGIDRYVTHYFSEGVVNKKIKSSDIANGLDLSSCKVWIEMTEDNVTYAKKAFADKYTHDYGKDWKNDAISHWHECDCGEKADMAEHTENSGTMTKEPTETDTGLKTYKCSICGYVIRTEEIQKLPPSHTHHYGSDWKTDTASHWHECDCGEKVDQAEHAEDSGTMTKEPTETETGLKTYKCSACGYVIRTEEIQKLPPNHTHHYGLDWKTDPASHWHECDCGEKADQAEHTEDAGTVTKEPTETETGLKTYKCSTCGYMVRTEEIQKLPPSHTHHYGSDWKTDTASHWHECDCGEKTDQVEHTEDSGIVTKKPTKTEIGKRIFKCSVCGYVTRTEDIDKLEDAKKPNKKPDTETSHDKLPPISKEERKENSIQINKKISFGWTGNSLTVMWNKLKNASGYDIYAAVCGNSFDEVTLSVKGGRKTHTKIKKVNGKNISKTTTYKVKIYAYRLVNGKKQYIGTSIAMHVAGSKNKKITNAKKIKFAKSSYVIRKGNTQAIKASIVKENKKKRLLSKKHGPKLMYTSSDTKIATVTKFGKIKAKIKGKCTIYVQALNGISRKVKVTVK